MNPIARPPSTSPAVDQDLAEQARPGHGIPSQDPNPAAQQPLDTQETEREGNSVLAGGGALVGVATGAAIGSVVGGPVGTVVGGTLGAVAGAVGGAAAGPLVDPKDPAPADTAPAAPPAARR